MSSIPLPALQIQQQRQPDVLGQYANIMQLKNMMQTSALQQQGMQLENQQRQMDLDSQKAITRAYVEAGGDLNATIPLAAKYGAKTQALIQLKQSAIEAQKANLQLLQEKGSRAIQEADAFQGAHDYVASLPPEQRANGYQQQLQALSNAGYDVSRAPQQYPGDEAFSIMGLGLKTHSQQLKDLASKADLAKTQAQTDEAQAVAAKNRMEVQQGGPLTDQNQFINNYLQTNGLANTPANRLAAQRQYIKETKIVPAQVRVEGYAQTRQYPVIDTRNGNALVYASAADINTANRTTPGRFVPQAGGAQALGKQALIEDIRGNIQSVRQSLQNPQMPEFTASQRAQIAVALGGQDPSGAIETAFRGSVLGNLTPEQQDYLITMAQLKENAMAMRSVLGAGQGSDDMRAAITATIPGPRTPSKGYALKQLDAFESVLNRLQRGVPNVPLRNTPQQGGGNTQQQQGTSNSWFAQHGGQAVNQ